MTDPVFGDNPIDPVALWNDTFRPALLSDPEWQIWRAVMASMMGDLLESQWLTRWRRSIMTAEGAQLQLWGGQLNYLQPMGWTEDRYRAVLIALLPASFGHPTTDVAFNLAEALLDVGQSFTAQEEWPATSRFTFLATDPNDAIAYLTALNRARASGHQYYLVAHDGGDPFVLDTSLLDSPDTLALMLESST